MSPDRIVSDEEFIRAVRQSRTFSELFRTLGTSKGGAAQKYAEKRANSLGVSMAHFQKGLHTNPRPLGLVRKPLEDLRDNRVLVTRLLRDGTWTYVCTFCGIHDWQGKALALQLDHADGNPTNNSLDNLRLLCPNCHSQTDTFTGRNRGRHPGVQRRKAF